MQIILGVGVSLAYILTFLIFYPLLLRSAIALAVIFIIWAANIFHGRGGVVMGLLFVPINIILFYVLSEKEGVFFLGTYFWLAHIVFLIVGAAIDKVNRTKNLLQAEVAARKQTDAALQASLNKAETLYKASNSLTALQDLPVLLQSIVDLAAATLPADRATLITFDMQTQQIIHFFKGGRGADKVVHVSYQELTKGLSGWVLRELKPALSSKETPDPRESLAVQKRRVEMECGAIIVAPLCYGHELYGTITVINRVNQRDFTTQDVEWLEALANQAVIAVKNNHLYEQLQQELTRHKKTGQALRESEVHLMAGQRVAHMGNWVNDLGAGELYWSDELFRILGVPKQKPSREFFISLLHPEDRTRFAEAVDTYAKKKIPLDVEARIIRPDGTIHYLHCRGEALYDQAGRPIKTIGIAQDITARVYMEQIIRRERKVFHVMAEAATLAIDVPDLCRRVLTGLVTILEYETGTVRFYDEEMRTLDIVAIAGETTLQQKKNLLPQTVDDPYMLAAFVARTRRPIFAPDAQKHTLHAHQARFKEDAIGSFISWPLIGTREKLIGVLHLVDSVPKEITEVDRSFFATVVEMFVTVLERKQASEALYESQMRYQSLFEDSPEALVEGDFSKIKTQFDELQVSSIADIKAYFKEYLNAAWKVQSLFKINAANEATLQLFEAGSNTELFNKLHKILNRESFGAFQQILVALASGHSTVSRELIFNTLTGKKIHVLLKLTAAPGFEQTWGKLLAVIIDITPRVEMEQRLRESEQRYRALFERTNDAIFIISLEQKYLAVNQQAADLLGYEVDELVGMNLQQLIAPEDWADTQKKSPLILSGKTPPIYERVFIRKDGTRVLTEVNVALVYDAAGDPVHIQSVVRDITERKKVEQQLEYLATHDALTGLPNRTLLADRLRQALLRAQRHKQQVAIAFLDLDGFKHVNDNYGHEKGDQLLQMVARRLQASVRKCDTVTRLGGDEFALIFEQIIERNDAATVAQKVLAGLRQPFKVNDHTLQISASMGISLYPEHGTDVSTLLKHADMAMYQVKDHGKDGFTFYVEQEKN